MPSLTRPATPLQPIAGVLSYLVPGLGQIVQGRVAKGVLFLVCIYTLFFYGMYLGSGSVTVGERTYSLKGNVYLPDTVEPRNGEPSSLPAWATNLYNRFQFAGQFWVGAAAWPALLQYANYNRTEVNKIDDQLEELYRKLENKPEEAEAQEIRSEIGRLERNPALRHPLLDTWMREPTARAINAVHNAGDKRFELAWVYTVIAGVLNIMVIYDAVAGPAFLVKGPGVRSQESAQEKNS
jgi:hypothetical protein